MSPTTLSLDTSLACGGGPYSGLGYLWLETPCGGEYLNTISIRYLQYLHQARLRVLSTQLTSTAPPWRPSCSDATRTTACRYLDIYPPCHNQANKKLTTNFVAQRYHSLGQDQESAKQTAHSTIHNSSLTHRDIFVIIIILATKNI